MVAVEIGLPDWNPGLPRDRVHHRIVKKEVGHGVHLEILRGRQVQLGEARRRADVQRVDAGEIRIGYRRQVRHRPFQLRVDARERARVIAAERDDLPPGQRAGSTQGEVDRDPGLLQQREHVRMQAAVRDVAAVCLGQLQDGFQPAQVVQEEPGRRNRHTTVSLTRRRSSRGGRPNMRLYSRVNCDGLS